ncbi:hypothetical protein [Roseimaritima ulvae]|nr:hypothetical protein [Roseimaritima ulvae]
MPDTQDQTESQDARSPSKRSIVGGIGLAFALLGLVAAIMSPWIIDVLEPGRKPIDEAAVEVATKIKDRLIAKAKGDEYIPPVETETGFDIGKWYPAGTIALGLCGICFGIGGFCRHEDLRITGSSVTVGLAAIVFQYFLLLAAAIIFFMLVAIILSALGIELPTP